MATQVTLNDGSIDSAGSLALKTNGTTTAVTIDTSQNVGIGTASPARKFEVIAAGAPAAQFVRTTTATNSLQTNPIVITRTSGNMADGFGTLVNHQIQDDAGVDNTIGYYGFVRNGADNSGAFYVATSNAGTAAERMRIDSSGNLLVGTTATIDSYGVAFSKANDRNLILNSSTSGSGVYTTLSFSNQGTPKAFLFWLSTDSRFYAQNGTGGVYIAQNGTTWTSTSDERIKTDLLQIENATQKVAALRAVTGRYKTDEEDTRRSFLIAQDVQAVFPEAVDADNPDELGVRYTDVIPLLVAAIKEQQALITTLTDRITALEAK
jgi:hypothetical protein